MINQLIHLIGQETLLFEEFLDLLERQKQKLVANDVDGINEITELQQAKLGESHRLHQRRMELINEIKQANALEGDLSVSRLLDFVDDDQAERLLQLKDLIFDLNEKITETRNTNAMLLNQSREFIAKTMSMLSRVNNPEPTYGSDGASTDPESTVMVDRRI